MKRIKELIESAYCTYEYDNGNTHECYEFSKDELILLLTLVVEAYENERG